MPEENKLSPYELENIKRALKSSYKERFEKATRLFKVHQTMKMAQVTHKTLINK